ncbi:MULTISPECIES: hypothetical protein [unclassified Streptomyces]|uniref:DUF6197 family protein n=1 Tax=unclassified Streptomyces TaxID=2593676 RepID=UPI00085176FF|nr:MULTISPECIES: hypothetical protein [unclassified Streptomyces]MDQ0701033.1 hypothetical protein [Streptomyces sp. W4I9-2]MDX3488262.1 hypothetical protein [Streptomyces sp. ID05-18]
MPQTHPATAPAPAPPAPPTALSLDERLVLANTVMTERLDEAAVAYEVNTAHIPAEPVDLADVVTVPLTPTLRPQSSPDSAAAVLRRAHHRLLTGGWCAGTFQSEDGALCLFGAVRSESHRDLRLEMSAMAVLLEAIRRQFGDRFDSVPSFNDAHQNGRVPLRMLDQAAGLADARGL